jgi:LPXTG-motif cell wall-anchored protein
LNNNNLGKNIEPVWKLTNLTELYIDNNGITNTQFSGVQHLKKLQKLSVNKNKLTYLDPVKGLTALKELYASNNNIDNLSGIKVGKFVADNQEIIISQDVNKSIAFNDKVLANRVSARLGNAIKSRASFNGKWAITLSTADLYKVENLDLSATANDSEKIQDVTGLEGFRNLKSLNLSNNKVTNFDKLSELPNLQTLIVRNNDLTNLNGLKDVKSLVQLDASTNLIDDVSGISNLKKLDIVLLNNNKLGDNISSLNNLAGNLSTLAIDNNNVTDLSKIDKLGAESVYASYNYLSKLGNVDNNTLTIKNNVLDIEVEGDECELPDIVKMAMANNGGLSCLELENCSIINNKVVIQPLIRNAQIKIIKGNAKNTVVNIKNKKYITPPVVNTTYTKVPEGVKVTLTIDKPIFYLWAWKREDDTYMKYSKIFRYNVSNQKVVIKDGYGNTTDVNININDIVNEKVPGLTVKYSEINPTQNDVVVTISADVALKDPEKSGWKLSADKKSISCTFTENNRYGKNIFLATNPSDFTSADYDANVQINVDNIDKTAPDCTVEYSNTDKTNSLVVATIWSDEEIDLENEAANLINKTSKQNDIGNTIYGISLGYLKNSNETINVKDLAGNIKPVSISISNIDNTLEGLNASTTGVTATNKDQTINVKANEKINLLKNANTTMADAENIFRRNKPWFAIAAVSPVIYLAEGENGSEGSDNQILVPATDASYGALEVSDEAGNTDLTVYNTNHIDKEAPSISVESEVKNEDGSVLVTLVSDEQLQNNVNQAGWTVSEDGLRLTKVFKSNRNETVVVRDLADNEGTLDLEVTGVSAIDYTIYYEPIENTDMVLVIISTNTELKPVDGWELLEDKKSIAKAISVDHEEKVLIEDINGYGSEVHIDAYNSKDENKETEDNTQANEILPQTGKHAAIAVVAGIVLALITLITIKIKKRKI